MKSLKKFIFIIIFGNSFMRSDVKLTRRKIVRRNINNRDKD